MDLTVLSPLADSKTMSYLKQQAFDKHWLIGICILDTHSDLPAESMQTPTFW